MMLRLLHGKFQIEGLGKHKGLTLCNPRKERQQMLWTYSASPNKYNIEFLLPPADEPELIKPEVLAAEEAQLTSETQQMLQNLCSNFLVELGYSVTENETAQLENNKLPSTAQAALDLMYSFAMCATIRDHSMRPLFLFNTLMSDIGKLTKQEP